jgi:acyl dehydratase
MMIKLKVGDKRSVKKIFTDSDVHEFSDLSLDKNPLHLDSSFAKETVFGQRIVHGLLGNDLAGKGGIYLGQSLNFTHPVFIDEEVTATVQVIKIREDKPIVTLRTFCVNSKGKIVIDGEAVVKVA